MKPDRNEDVVHKRALDMLRGPYLLAPASDRCGDGSRVPARESGDHGRDGTEDTRRRSAGEKRAAE